MSNFSKVKNSAIKQGKIKSRKKRYNQGWARNVLRSLGYSAQDVISELMPNTIDTVDSARDIREQLTEAAGVAKTKVDEGYSKLKTRLQTFSEKELKEAMEDLKSGKLYNKERMEAAESDFDFGDDFNFDDSFGDFDEDFDSDGSELNVKSNNPDTNVAISMRIGESSPIVQSQDATTAAVTAGFNTSARMSNENTSQMIASIATMSSSVTSELKLLTSEMNKLTSTIPETITSQAALRTDYFDKSLAYQERMANALDIISKSYGVTGKLAGLGKYEHSTSKLDDKVYMGMSDYFENIKKQAVDAVNDNALVQMYKMQKELKDSMAEMGMGDLGDNKPLLAKGLNAAVKTLVPHAVKGSAEKLDNFFSNIFLPVGMKINKWKNDWDNPIKQYIGKIFGISASGRTEGDKEAYEKGAVAFDGKVHRAITDIIPTYLSKILSAVSGSEETAFDYQHGVYNTVSQLRKNYEKEMRDEATMPYISGKMSFNNAVGQMDIDKKQKDNLEKTFNDFLYNMTMSGSSDVSWRKRGDKDDIARFTGKSSDSQEVQFIRKFFESMYDKGMHSELEEMFSSNIVRGRANLDKTFKDMSKDGTIHNYNLIDNGFDQNGEHAMKIKPAGGLASDKYGNSSMYYLREILETLNTGIRVTVVGKGSDEYNEINSRRGTVSTNLKSHIDALNSHNSDDMGNDDGTGDVDSNAGFTEENINKAFDSAIRTYDTDKLGDALESWQYRFGDNHPIGKFIAGIRKRRDKANQAVNKVTNSITGFFTDLLFGKRPGKGGTSENGENDEQTPDEIAENAKDSIMGSVLDHMKDFGNSIHNVVIEPLKKALFDKDTGLVSNMVETAEQWKNSFKKKLLGDKNEDGYYENGYFSKIANVPKNVKDKAKSLKNMLLNGDPEGNEPAVIKAIRDAVGTDDKGKLDLKGKGSGLVADLRQHISKRAHEWTDNIFGPSDEGEPDKLDTFLGDMSANKGALGITTSLGLMASFFLPVGPVGGALLGLATGIAANSSQFKDFIFGKEDENGERTGGVIRKEWQDKFNGSKDALAKGAGIGLIGSMFLPGGPVLGAVVGAGLGLAAKTEAFGNLLYGEGGDEKDPTGGLAKYVKTHYGNDKSIKDAAIDTGIGAGLGIIGSMFLPGGPVLGAIVGGGLAIARKTEAFSNIMYGEGGSKDDPTGGITKFVKDHWNSSKDADDAFLDAGIGAGVGILGSFFLPGGPILGGLIGAGASMALNSEKFQEYLFGKKDEDGKRSGGLLHRAADKASDFMFDQTEKLTLWMDKNVINPLKASIDPIKQRFVNFFDDKKTQVASLIFGEKDEEGARKGGLLGAIADRVNESAFGELKRTIKTEVVDRIKNGFSKLFGGFFKMLGNIIKAPIDAITRFAERSDILNLQRDAADGSDAERQKKAQHRLAWYENGASLVQGNIDDMNAASEDKAKKRREERARKKEERRKKKRTPEQVVAENSQETVDVAKLQLEETKSGNAGIIAALGNILEALIPKSKKKKSAPTDETTSTETTQQEESATDDTETEQTGGGKSKKKDRKATRRGRQNKKNKRTNRNGVVTDPNVIQDIIDKTGDGDEVDDNSGDITNRNFVREFIERLYGKAGSAKDSITNRARNFTSNTKGKNSPTVGEIIDRIHGPNKPGSDNSTENKPSIIADPEESLGKNVSKISKSVDGQLNGVGHNTYRIYKLLKKRLGKGLDDDDDDDGSDAKPYRSFLRRALDLATSPFRLLHKAGKAVVGTITGAVRTVVGGVVDGGKAIVKGVLGVGKAIITLPAKLAEGVISAIPTLAKGAAKLVTGSLNFVGNIIGGIGKTLYNASEGLGKAMSKAIEGFGTLIWGTLAGIGNFFHGIGILGKEGIKLGIKAGKGLFKGIGKVGSAIGGSLFKGKTKSNKQLDVNVIGGHLDSVKVVEKIGSKKGKKGKSSNKGRGTKALLDIFTADTDENSSENPIADIISKVADENEAVTGKGGKGGKGDKKSKISLLEIFKKKKDKDEGSPDGPSDKSENKRSIGRTAADFMAQRLRERENEEKKSMFKSLLSTIKEGNDDNKKHHSIWNSIFSKKGIITMGIIAAAPFILKFIKNFNLDKLLGSIISGIKDGWKEIGGILGLVNNVGEKVDHVAETIAGQEKQYVVDDDGNLVRDENGNPVQQLVDRSRTGIALMKTKTRIDPETGKWENRQDWTQLSGATAKLAGKKVNHQAKKFISKLPKKWQNASLYETGKKVGTKVTQFAQGVATKGKNFVQAGRDLNALKSAGSAFAGEAGIGQKFAGKVVWAADNVASGAAKFMQSGKDLNELRKTGSAFAKEAGTMQKMAAAADTGSTVIKKFITKAKEAVTFVVEKLAGVGEKFGGKIGTSKFGTIVKKIYDVLDEKVLQRFLPKITNFFKKLSARTLTAAIDWGFAIYGVLNGAVNAAGLFEVPKDAVDGKMRAISAVFGGISNTLAGSVLDFISCLIYDIAGFNILKSLATWAYSFIANDEDEQALSAAQEDFTKGYEDYVAQEYEAYVQDAEANGEQAMSYEEFKASDRSTTRSEYNAEQNKSLLRRGIDAVKGVGGGLAKGAKKVGNAIKNSAVGKVTSFTIDTGKKAASAVWNQGKAVFGKIGDSIGTAVADGTAAVKGIITGMAQITKNYENKENGFVDYMRADVNPLDESNSFHGLVGGILGVSKVVMLPKLIAAGVMKKVGGSLIDGIKKIFNGAKTAFGDYVRNDATIKSLALKGDVRGLAAFQPTMSEDNPIGGIISAIGGIQRYTNMPVATISFLAQSVVRGVKTVIAGAKSTYSDYMTNTAGIQALALKGDISGLTEYEITASEDNPLSGITSAVAGIQRITAYPIALVALVGHKISDGIHSIVSKFAQTGPGKAIVDIGSMAMKGDMQGLKEYQPADEEGNPMGSFTKAVSGITKMAMYPVAGVVHAGRSIVDILTGKNEKANDMGAKIKSFIGTLNTYTDPDKDMSGWDKETLGEEGDLVGGIVSSLLKKIMYVYVSTIRWVKSGLGWLGDAGQWILDKIDKAGTTIMDAGRGGKGGEDEGTSSSGVANNFPYYSQNDPSIKNKEYKLSSGERDTMGNRGCGPVAMSMVASGLTGQKVDPTSMAQYATANGYNQESGTLPGYFGSAASSMGIDSQLAKPTAENITGMLGSGKPVILQGRDASGSSPYTSEGHYVVGVGMKNGNVLINDPRGKSYSGEYSMDEVTNGAENLWGFSGGLGGKGGGTDSDMANGFPFLLQGDARWGNVPYTSIGDSSQTISTSACGPTSMAMVARSFGNPVTPVDTIKYSLAHGYRTANSGTSWGFFNNIAADNFGLDTKQYTHAQAALTDLKAGKPVIASMGPSTFTKGGHYIVLSGMTEDGQILVNDPASTNRTNTAWDPSIFAKEGKQFWSFSDSKTGKGSINNIKSAGNIGLEDMAGKVKTALEAGAPSNKKIGGTEQADTSTETEEKSPLDILSDIAGIFMDAGKVFAEKLFGKSKSKETPGVIADSASALSQIGQQVSGIVNSADDVQGGDTSERGWNYFTSMGYSKPATAGILGNLAAESRMNPKTIQNNGKGPAAGLAQWENYNTRSGRWAGLESYAQSKGKDWTDEGSQFEYINNELNSLGGAFWRHEGNMSKAGATPTSFDQWKASNDIDMATRQFEGAFERAGIINMDERIKAAKKYYEMYADKPQDNNWTLDKKEQFLNLSKQASGAAKNVPVELAGMGGKPDDNVKSDSTMSLVTGGKGGRTVSENQTPRWTETSDKIRSLDVKISESEMTASAELLASMNQAIQYLKVIADNTFGTKEGVNSLNNKDFGGTTIKGGDTNNVHNNVNTQSQSDVPDQKYYNIAKEIASGIYRPA